MAVWLHSAETKSAPLVRPHGIFAREALLRPEALRPGALPFCGAPPDPVSHGGFKEPPGDIVRKHDRKEENET